MTETLNIAPELRLLKMLGEDLIKDEKTALIELVKNSYDADATTVKVFFENFGNKYEFDEKSEIYIIDNGEGMTKDEIINNWLSPGTANKKRKKISGNKTKLGRVYQGEKGIGRYAMLKLARSVELFTKTESEDNWNYANLDLSKYDDDYLNTDTGSNLLSDLQIVYEEKSCDTENIQQYLNNKNGTILKLSNLNGKWGTRKVNDIYDDLARLEPISSIIHDWKASRDVSHYFEKFGVSFYLNGKETNHQNIFKDDLEKFLDLCDKKCLLSVTNGTFNDKTGTFNFYVNGLSHTVNIESKEFNSKTYRRYFKEEIEGFEVEDLTCGPFEYEFYIFTFYKRPYLEEFRLTTEEKNLVDKHRIYLYRDNARVYPYGEPKNDWLGIDALRGVNRIGEFLSNDQTVGFISITHDKNPHLRDKTNREGLIEDGEATFEFVALFQSFLNYLKNNIYDCILENLKNESEKKAREEEIKRRKEEEEEKRLREIERRKKEQEEEKRLNAENEKRALIEKKRMEEIKKKEEDLKSRENEISKEEKRLEKQKKEIADAYIDMTSGKTEFFRHSSILNLSANEKITINYNELIKQVTSLKYENHYLIYVMALRTILEDQTKCYIVSRKLLLGGGLGENVKIMIDDLKKLINRKDTTLSLNEKNELESLLGGAKSFNSQLDVIKSEFHDGAKQQVLATKLNTFTHSPRRIPKEEALDITNDKILPLIVISQRAMSLVNKTNKNN
ncbi:ATP-binding protein [Enterococcus sp. AZ196]|uniref:ATP-binding protein n=1 Tax=Enterococcus sp. AZ196 TaxID=2774659 RepID=UPI003D2A19F4